MTRHAMFKDSKTQHCYDGSSTQSNLQVQNLYQNCNNSFPRKANIQIHMELHGVLNSQNNLLFF